MQNEPFGCSSDRQCEEHVAQRVGQCRSDLAHRNSQQVTGTVSMAVDPALRGATAGLLGVNVRSGDEALMGCGAVMMLSCEPR